jgi:Methyltransferase domain
LPFADRAFDVVFSNSVIEHVSTWERQMQFAAGARRVGRKLWVQTPAYEFFIEPHLMTPFIHWLPVRWQRRLLRNFTPWGWLTRPPTPTVDAFIAEVRLLTRSEMRKLFPECEILEEKFLGMTKSYIAVRVG